MSERRIEIAMSDLIPLMQERLAQGYSVTFSPRGSSMLPLFREGLDTVTLSPLPKRLHKYDLPLYQRANGQYVLHRIVKVGETYTCIGDNQFQLENGVGHEQLIAVVTAFQRGNRTYTVTDRTYKLYCRLWHYSRPLRRIWRSVKIRVKRKK